MTLQQLNYVLTIAKTGSMNKAASELFISQPSLTSAVKALENEIGISVFIRSGRGVSPTPEGEKFLMYARQVYQQYERLSEKYIEKSADKKHFSVSSQHYSFAVDAFVKTVKKFDTKHFEFAFRETKTAEVIEDVGKLKSEIGILYLSDYNRKVITKLLNDNELEFNKLIECSAYVYLYKEHPLAKNESIGINELCDYPCLSFEQGDKSSFFLAEEILSDLEYERSIKANDRATMLNLMKGLNGFTLCSGIICEQLNGSDYIAVPFKEDNLNRNSVMEIGYITKKRAVLSEIGEVYLDELKKYLNKVSKG